MKVDLYDVVLYNDDYSHMSFVIALIMNIFNKSLKDATDDMMYIHENDYKLYGPYSKDVAQTKVDWIIESANKVNFPLFAEISHNIGNK